MDKEYTVKFRIIAEGNKWKEDITEKITDRLIEVTITDGAGIEADQMTISLDDRDGTIEWPEEDAKLIVELGYAETGIVKMGEYFVKEIQYHEPPCTMTIVARSAAYANSALKSQKTRTWPKDITISALVKKMAAEHGLKPLVSGDLGQIKLPITHQTEESDLNLLTRLASDYAAIAKPAAGYLLFVLRGESKDANGNDLKPVMITRDLVLANPGLDVTDTKKNKYASVVAYYQDTKKAKRKVVRVGTGEPTFSMKFNYANEQQALNMAQAKLDAINRQSKTLSLSMKGDPNIIAESPLLLEGFRKKVDGKWVATSVMHRFNSSFFTTRIEQGECLD